MGRLFLTKPIKERLMKIDYIYPPCRAFDKALKFERGVVNLAERHLSKNGCLKIIDFIK